MIRLLGGTVDQEKTVTYKSYAVKSGDTLSTIAKKYGTTVNDIMQINRIADKNRIYVGQKIYIP